MQLLDLRHTNPALSLFFQPNGGTLIDGSVYLDTTTLQCYTVYDYKDTPPVLPFPGINVSQLTLIDEGCSFLNCQIACNPCVCYRVRYTGVVDPKRRAETMKAGMFRSDAALNVLIVSDEQDVCTELHKSKMQG